MKPRHDNFFKIIQLYSPTQNLILFHVIYSESKSDKYNPPKLQSTLTLSSLTREKKKKHVGDCPAHWAVPKVYR